MDSCPVFARTWQKLTFLLAGAGKCESKAAGKNPLPCLCYPASGKFIFCYVVGRLIGCFFFTVLPDHDMLFEEGLLGIPIIDSLV